MLLSFSSQPSAEFLHNLTIVRNFLATLNAEKVEDDLWEKVFGFINKYDDVLTVTERNNVFFTHARLCNALQAMIMVMGEME
jgi:hypothetical protein